MKILHVTQAYFPFQEKGGPVVKVRALAAGLGRLGHSVTVLTADLGLKNHSVVRSQLQKHELGWRLELDRAEVLYLPTVASFHALTINPRVLRFCETRLQAFDVVHFFGLYDLLAPAIGHFCRRRSIPYVLEPMGMFRRIDRSLRLKLLWHRLFGKSLISGAAKIVATSELERNELLAGGVPSGKVVIRYNGVDRELLSSVPTRGAFRAKWGLPAEEWTVLFISRLIPRKGVDLLIRAFCKVCQKSGRLVIAGPEGKSGYRQYLEKLAAESGAAERILFCGALYDADKKAALADADVFVLPSRYENFANVAAEAMACGLPVIVTDACGISPLVQNQGGLIIAPQEDALSEALTRLANDRQLYARLKNGCRRVAEELNWDTLTQQMEGYYREAVSSCAASKKD